MDSLVLALVLLGVYMLIVQQRRRLRKKEEYAGSGLESTVRPAGSAHWPDPTLLSVLSSLPRSRETCKYK